MRRSMQFGYRKVRSAGRRSGSVEFTLPVDLAILEGVPCRIELRDGLMPEVVLQPVLDHLRAIFETVWERQALGLARIGEIGEFSEADYVVGLFPERSPIGRPTLTYADALLVQRNLASGEPVEPDGRARSLEAFARLLEPMATVAGQRLGLSMTTATLFGNQVAYTATGAPLPTIDTFARSSLADRSTEIGWCTSKPLAEPVWLAARHRLQRLYERLADWDADAGSFEQQREHWYRARRMEAHLRPALAAGA